jgi:hypothetical protein
MLRRLGNTRTDTSDDLRPGFNGRLPPVSRLDPGKARRLRSRSAPPARPIAHLGSPTGEADGGRSALPAKNRARAEPSAVINQLGAARQARRCDNACSCIRGRDPFREKLSLVRPSSTAPCPASWELTSRVPATSAPFIGAPMACRRTQYSARNALRAAAPLVAGERMRALQEPRIRLPYT